MLQQICGFIYFLCIVGLTLINGFWLITLDELEMDHLNPADVTRKLNVLVVPEMIVHGILLLVCLVSLSPWVFFFNLPLAVYFAYKVSKNEHILDPTEILRYKKLKATRVESIAKTVFYGIQIPFAMYWLISSLIQGSMKPRRGKILPKSKSAKPQW